MYFSRENYKNKNFTNTIKQLAITLITIILLFMQLTVVSYASDLDKAEPSEEPKFEISTLEPQDVTALNVVFSGKIHNPKGDEISEYGFFFGDSKKTVTYKLSNFEKTNDEKITYKIDFMEESNMKLIPEKEYYYKSYAVIGDKTYYGKIKSFITEEIVPFTKVNGYIYDNNKEVIPGASQIGIDVSHWQGKIDWGKIKESGIDFVIIRCGFGTNAVVNDDDYFIRNVEECIKYDIPFGIYIYSYATNVRRAKSEANHVLRLIDGYEVDLPIYYDIEDPSINHLSKYQLASNAETFCSIIKQAGYKVGIYANWRWWTYKLTSKSFDNETWYKWIAAWEFESIDYGKYDIWQFTEKGIIEGIDGPVDINILFDNKTPQIINFEDRAELIKPMTHHLLKTITDSMPNPLAKIK